MIRAFGTTKPPAILDSNITQAAFVSEASAYLRFHALALCETEVETRMAIAAEEAFEQVTGHEILIHGKNLEPITALLTKGTGLHLRMIDERYLTMLPPNATLITKLSVRPLAKFSVN